METREGRPQTFHGKAINLADGQPLPTPVTVIIEPRYLKGRTYPVGPGVDVTEPDLLAGGRVRGIPDGSWRIVGDTWELTVTVADGETGYWAYSAKA